MFPVQNWRENLIFVINLKVIKTMHNFFSSPICLYFSGIADSAFLPDMRLIVISLKEDGLLEELPEGKIADWLYFASFCQENQGSS